MKSTTRRAGVIGFFVLAMSGVHAESDEARQPVPDTGARSAPLTELKKEFGEKLTHKDPEVRRTLARTLLERGKAADGDAVRRYVALELAATLSEGVRDLSLALDVVEQLALRFQVDRAIRGLAAVDAITHGAKDTGIVAEASSACVELVGFALWADDPNTANRAITTAASLARSIKLGGLTARATAILDLVSAFRRASATVAGARRVLTATPEDAAANETLGRYLAFGRGRFDEGFEHLAKSGDAALAELATKEQKHPEDVATVQAVADGWWDLAQKEKDPLAKARMLARAASSYEKAPPDAPPERLALQKARLDSITYRAFDRGVALTKDFSKDGPASVGLATVRGYIAERRIDRASNDWRTKLPRPPDVTFSRGEEYVWRLDTNQGPITLRLFADTAPKHVANFLYLTELGFFDGLLFHRVVPGFMAQGGCPKRNGSGNPGYMFAMEPNTTHKHDKPGVLSMANTGEPSSDGSQFFITFRATPDLDPKHTVCGEVVEGMDVVKKLDAQGTPDPGVPKIPLVINGARVSLR